MNLPIDPSSLRVAFLAGTLGRGGAERQLIYMLRALQGEGVKTRVLCLTKGEAFEQEILDLGIKVDWVGASQNNLVRLKRVIGNLRSTPVDIIQSAHFYTNIYAALAGHVLNVPSIGAIRNDLTSEIVANGIFGKWQLSLPGSQIANSTLALERAVAMGYPPEKIHLVRNVVMETGEHKALKNGLRTRLLFAGRLVEQKRPELFVELAFRLVNLFPNEELEFIVAGDGSLRQKLEQLSNEKGLKIDKMKFLGERSNMSDVYRNTDILIVTSAHEGTPNVILEAMAHGIPVVATRVGGVPEILGKECGVLVEPDDLQDMVNAVQTLILDRGKRYKFGDHAREYVRKNHSVEYLQERLTGIYSQVLAKI